MAPQMGGRKGGGEKGEFLNSLPYERLGLGLGVPIPTPNPYFLPFATLFWTFWTFGDPGRVPAFVVAGGIYTYAKVFAIESLPYVM